MTHTHPGTEIINLDLDSSTSIAKKTHMIHRQTDRQTEQTEGAPCVIFLRLSTVMYTIRTSTVVGVYTTQDTGLRTHTKHGSKHRVHTAVQQQ